MLIDARRQSPPLPASISLQTTQLALILQPDRPPLIAVGTPIAGRPPHRSTRAAFPHVAPTSGICRQSVCSAIAFRTRSNAWFTRARSCARCVLCWPPFPLVPGLGSTGSAAGCPALFVGFVATMPGSDF